MRCSSLFTNSDQTVKHRRKMSNAATPNDAKRSRTNPEQFHKKATKKLPYRTKITQHSLDTTRCTMTIFIGGTNRDGDTFTMTSLLQTIYMPLPTLLLNCFRRDSSLNPPPHLNIFHCYPHQPLLPPPYKNFYCTSDIPQKDHGPPDLRPNTIRHNPLNTTTLPSHTVCSVGSVWILEERMKMFRTK